MYTKALMFGVYTETPMHPGSGVSINRPIDLPIQRERHTDFPFIQGSSIKGVLRSFALTLKEGDTEVLNSNDIKVIFGPEDSSQVGIVSVTDARLVAFPVRTLAGVFGWVTCPIVLDRFRRDLSMVGIQADWEIEEVNKDQALVPDETNLALSNNQIVVEDIRLNKTLEKKQGNFAKITNVLLKLIPKDPVYAYLRGKISKDTMIVHDDLFKELTLLTTEVVARIRIDQQKGTAAEGALWYEEQIPTDTLLYFMLFISRRYTDHNSLAKTLAAFDGSVVQIGGDETVGRGFARLSKVG